MAICCAVGCSNQAKMGMKLYRLPSGKRNELRRKLWLIRIARDKWIPNQNSRLCQAHFEEDQFENHRADNRRLLKQSAVPSIFSHRPPKKSRKLSNYVLQRDSLVNSSCSSDFSMEDKNGDEDQDSYEAPLLEELLENVPDNVALISSVEKRPVIWDKTLGIHKNRTLTEKAWEEVCREIRTDFEDLKAEERKNFGKEVVKRWKNLRNAFCKAEKREKEAQASGPPVKKRRDYIFSKELQFLKKTFPNEETTDSITVEEKRSEEADESSQQTPEKIICEVDVITETEKNTTSNMQLRRKREKMDEKNSETVREIADNDAPDKPILQSLLENFEPEQPASQIVLGKVWSLQPTFQSTSENASSEKLNHQMAFFQSLLGHTQSFDGNEWLQFQMEVLRTISNIKNQKAAVPR